MKKTVFWYNLRFEIKGYYILGIVGLAALIVCMIVSFLGFSAALLEYRGAFYSGRGTLQKSIRVEEDMLSQWLNNYHDVQKEKERYSKEDIESLENDYPRILEEYSRLLEHKESFKNATFSMTLDKTAKITDVQETPVEQRSTFLFFGAVQRSRPYLMFLFACTVVVSMLLFAVEKDYRDGKSIYTRLRLPYSRNWYYLFKLALPVAVMVFFWLLQWWLTGLEANQYLHGEVGITDLPVLEAVPQQGEWGVGNNPYFAQFYPFVHLSRLPAALCLLVLIPASVLLLLLAVKGGVKNLGFMVLACVGFLNVVLYFLAISYTIWLVPCTTVIVVAAGLWLVNKVRILQ